MTTRKEVKDRFEVITRTLVGVTIIIDKVTGIQYLSHATSGITPLLNVDGKPYVSKSDNDKAF